jgi:hypothetical protein
MTADQTRILEMFRALSPDEREALLPELAEAAGEDEFDELSPKEIAAIDEGLAQMRRGETIDADVLFDRLAEKFGFSRA